VTLSRPSWRMSVGARVMRDCSVARSDRPARGTSGRSRPTAWQDRRSPRLMPKRCVAYPCRLPGPASVPAGRSDCAAARTSRAATATRPSRRASSREASSTRPPRPTFLTMSPGLTFASASRPRIPCEESVSPAHRTRASDRARTSSSEVNARSSARLSRSHMRQGADP
jgi:hypothetical protein